MHGPLYPQSQDKTRIMIPHRWRIYVYINTSVYIGRILLNVLILWNEDQPKSYLPEIEIDE